MSSVIWISDGDGDIDVVCVSPSPGIARKASTTNGPEMDAEALWAQVSTSETPQFKSLVATLDEWNDEVPKSKRSKTKPRDPEQESARNQAKVDKEIARKQAQKEKDVNKLYSSKNDAIRQLHLYIAPDLLSDTSPIAAALAGLEARLKDNLSALHSLNGDVPSVIRFKRHVQARYDAPTRRWLPLDSSRWEWEDVVLVVVTAQEIVDIISRNELIQWLDDIRLILSLKPHSQLLLMIRGMSKYKSKSKAAANREFTAAARAGGPIATNARYNTKDVEEALLDAQHLQSTFIVQVESPTEIQDWLYNLAADIAIRPYKLLQKSHLNICPTDGARKGATPTAAFELMLQEVQGITPSGAAGIANEYPRFRDLMEAYDEAERRGDAEQLLEHCEIRNLRNGTANGRRLNKALARKVHQAFREQDSLVLG